MERLRQTDVKFVKGVGPKMAELLEKELGIRTCYDLLYHFPNQYVDRSKFYSIADFEGDMPMVQVKGHFISFTVQGEGAKTRLIGLFTDGSKMMEVVWFHRIKWIRENYRTGLEYVLFGKPSPFQGSWSMVHPEIDLPQSREATRASFRGVYPLTEKLRNRGVSSRMISGWQSAVLERYAGYITEPLPPELMSRLKIMPKAEAIKEIHHPRSRESLDKARFRLKFEELFYLQLNILSYCRKRSAMAGGFRFSRVGRYFHAFYEQCMPFELTGAQKRVIKEIRADMNSGRQMNRLLQGDVGSGKTLVALLTMLIALDNGYQACLMAPTEILATQHYDTISGMAAKVGVNVGVNVKLLTGSTRKKERDVIASQLADGSLHILIGTHAVIEDKVQFANLGFVVIDEQHRFGVAQRAALAEKGDAPHKLVMSATPIPRTLALIIYGDLDISVINQLPKGRKPVKTYAVTGKLRERAFGFVRDRLDEGRQAYVVCPMIEDSESDLLAVKSYAKKAEKGFLKGYAIALHHGKMKSAEKEKVMKKFRDKEIQVLICTTVVEVGVDVPNAAVMVIENADRFGLSQLHQLRGRVGRGEFESSCILITDNTSEECRQRMKIMSSTSDGFKISEEDLKMRGPGDFFGSAQHGLPPLKIADIACNSQLLGMAQQCAKELLDSDPQLRSPEHCSLKIDTLRLFNKEIIG